MNETLSDNTYDIEARQRRDRARRSNIENDKGFSDVIINELIICIILSLLILLINIFFSELSAKIWEILNSWLSAESLDFAEYLIELLKSVKG